MKKFDVERFSPLGYNFETEKNTFLTLSTCSLVYSVIIFFLRFFDSYNRLYTHRNGKRVLLEGRMMEHFYDLTHGVFYGFFVVMFVSLCFIILRYSFHWQGTKSIYTMKRLPKKSELSKRCVILPLVLVFILILFILLLAAFYLAVYFIFTPKQCLYPFGMENFWRAFI